MLTYRNANMKESEFHFLQTQKNSHVLAIFQHYINPFVSVTQHLDLRRLDLVSIAKLNYGGKHNSIFIQITGQGQGQKKVVFK